MYIYAYEAYIVAYIELAQLLPSTQQDPGLNPVTGNFYRSFRKDGNNENEIF